ncbi:MAG TPA: hypothetical protein PL009_06485 [Flavipsychrobacter sp.]|nr:hypothetical protein [Flavipsychrobacter sp.]
MKTWLSNILTAFLVNTYMAFTTIAVLFEKQKRKKSKKTPAQSIRSRQPSISKG